MKFSLDQHQNQNNTVHTRVMKNIYLYFFFLLKSPATIDYQMYVESWSQFERICTLPNNNSERGNAESHEEHGVYSGLNRSTKVNSTHINFKNHCRTWTWLRINSTWAQLYRGDRLNLYSVIALMWINEGEN